MNRYKVCDNEPCSGIITIDRWPDPPDESRDYCSKACYDVHYHEWVEDQKRERQQVANARIEI